MDFSRITLCIIWAWQQHTRRTQKRGDERNGASNLSYKIIPACYLTAVLISAASGPVRRNIFMHPAHHIQYAACFGWGYSSRAYSSLPETQKEVCEKSIPGCAHEIEKWASSILALTAATIWQEGAVQGDALSWRHGASLLLTSCLWMFPQSWMAFVNAVSDWDAVSSCETNMQPIMSHSRVLFEILFRHVVAPLSWQCPGKWGGFICC